jgi:tetratricopeptide (TPR) repeat protein
MQATNDVAMVEPRDTVPSAPDEAALFAPDEAALFARGQTLRAAGHWQEAIVALEAASVVNPGRAETLLSLGVLRLQHGQPADAIGLIQRALAIRPSYAEAWDALGHARMAMVDPGASFDAFTQACTLNPANLAFQLHRAQAATRCNQSASLREILEADLAANPLSAAPLVGLGMLAIRDHRTEDAIDLLEAALTLDDGAPEPPMLLGEAYSMAQLPARAAPMLRLALQRDPENHNIVNDLAVTIARLYCYEEAVALLTGSIEKIGPRALTLSNLAVAQAALGEMQAGIAAAQEAMLLAPKDIRASRAWCNQLPYQDNISGRDTATAAATPGHGLAGSGPAIAHRPAFQHASHPPGWLAHLGRTGSPGPRRILHPRFRPVREQRCAGQPLCAFHRFLAGN